MVNCPSCGSPLEDGQKICPKCGATVDLSSISKEPSKTKNEDLSKQMEEMRQRIRHLSQRYTEKEQIPSEPKSEAPVASPAIEEKVTETKIDEKVEVGDIEVEAKDVDVEIKEEEKKQFQATEIQKHIGRGAINGLGLDFPESKKYWKEEKSDEYTATPSKRKSKILKWQTVVAIVVVAVIISASILVILSFPGPSSPQVDGNFDDWADITTYGSFYESDNPSLDFWDNGAQFDNGRVYWYFLTDGNIYESASEVTSYILLIDSDGLSQTGFTVNQYFGADLMAMISGCDGDLISASLSKFNSLDVMNWSAWSRVSSLNVQVVEYQAECSFYVPSEISFSQSNARFISVSSNGVDRPSITPVFALEPGVLIVTQQSLVSSSGQIEISSGEEILELHVRGFGELLSVESINPVIENASMSGQLSASWNTYSEMYLGTTLSVFADLSATSQGSKVTAYVTPDSITTEFPSVMIIGDPAIGYAGEMPSGIVIDGCFSDWTLTFIDLDPIPIVNEDVDIRKSAADSDSSDAFFYAEVMGDILAGAFVPVQKSVQGQPGQGSSGVPLERVTGEDVLNIYIDVDPTFDSGAPSPVPGETIRPDYLIEIEGRNGEIKQKTLSQWEDDWTRMGSTGIEAAKDSSRIEVGISKNLLGGNLSQVEILFETTDWQGYGDNSSLTGALVDPFMINITAQVWGSADGSTWNDLTEVLPNSNSAVDLTSDENAYLYVLFNNGTVYRSVDTASSWSRIIDHTFGAGEIALGITCDRQSNLYMLADESSVYVAPLTGGSWLLRGEASPPRSDYIDIDWVNGTNPASTVLYAIKSTTGAQGTVTSTSTDGGLSWTGLTQRPPTDSTVSAIAAVRSGNNDLIYVLETDGDVRVSNDSGSTWEVTHISSGGGTSLCVDMDTDSNQDVWVVRSEGPVYKLNVTTWTWTTVCSINDKNEIQAFSTAPIPEFGDIGLILVMLTTISVMLVMRKRKEQRQKQK